MKGGRTRRREGRKEVEKESREGGGKEMERGQEKGKKGRNEREGRDAGWTSPILATRLARPVLELSRKRTGPEAKKPYINAVSTSTDSNSVNSSKHAKVMKKL